MWLSMQIQDQLIDPRQRAEFWIEIVDVLHVVDSWIVGVDFNNLESPSDFQADSPSPVEDCICRD